jgi:hypothetical protein
MTEPKWEVRKRKVDNLEVEAGPSVIKTRKPRL